MNKKLVGMAIGLLLLSTSSLFSQSKKDKDSFGTFLNSLNRPVLIAYTDNTKKFGLMDSVTHEIIIPAQFDQLNHFINGMAVVRISNKYGFVSDDGKVISPKYDCVTLFSENYAAVFNGEVSRDSNNTITDFKGIWAYIDKSGKEVIPFKYTTALPFSEGLANVALNNKVGFIDKDQKTIIPFIYEDGDSFKNGKARVKLNNEWIYINIIGEKITNTNTVRYYKNICEAIYNEDNAAIKDFLTKKVDLNVKYDYVYKNEYYVRTLDAYPLDLLIQSQNREKFELLKLFIEKGLNVNLEYKTPLIITAVEYKPYEEGIKLVQLLIDHQVNINAQHSGQNALHVIAYGGCANKPGKVAIAKLLLENGIDKNFKDNFGMTPLKRAKDYDYDKCDDMVNLIKKFKKK